MSYIILTRGIPGSGKSTWAKEMVEDSFGTIVRLNRDDMRESIFGEHGVLDQDREKMITQITEFAARKAIAAGKDVIIDAMNLDARYLKAWGRFGVPVLFQDFPTPVGECIARDNERERNVGIRVISKIVKRFKIQGDGTLPPQPIINVHDYKPAPDYSHLKTDAIIVDIDNTLAHLNGRGPYETGLYHTDNVDESVREIVNSLSDRYHVIITSGRSDEFRWVTEKWLNDNMVLFDEMHMRKSGDFRDDAIVKHDIFHSKISNRFNIVMVFDDRDRVVAAWRKMGLKVSQVAYGDF